MTTDQRAILEIPAELPRDGGRVWYFPGAADHGHADTIARVYRRDGSSWVACLTSGDGMFTSIDAFVLPCGERVFLCGGVADRDDPRSWRPLSLGPTPSVYWSPDRDVVVLCDYVSLEVFGPSGPIWRAIGIAELTVDAVTQDQIVCTAWDPVLSDNVERRFDLRTGQEVTTTGL